MEEKLSPLYSLKEILSEDEAAKMGRKDPEEEVEKFVSANTQELGKDKWLCPLSGKKFKVSKTVFRTVQHVDFIAVLSFTVLLLDSYCDAKTFCISI